MLVFLSSLRGYTESSRHQDRRRGVLAFTDLHCSDLLARSSDALVRPITVAVYLTVV
jgi:hypothetical protein